MPRRVSTARMQAYKPQVGVRLARDVRKPEQTATPTVASEVAAKLQLYETIQHQRSKNQNFNDGLLYALAWEGYVERSNGTRPIPHPLQVHPAEALAETLGRGRELGSGGFGKAILVEVDRQLKYRIGFELTDVHVKERIDPSRARPPIEIGPGKYVIKVSHMPFGQMIPAMQHLGMLEDLVGKALADTNMSGVNSRIAGGIFTNNSPNGVEVAHRLFSVSKFLEGRSYRELGYRVRQWYIEGKITQEVKDKILKEFLITAATRLAQAHERGIMHGDVNEENLRTNPEGGTDLIDWGIGRPLYGSLFTRYSFLPFPLGTPEFLPKERLMPNTKISEIMAPDSEKAELAQLAQNPDAKVTDFHPNQDIFSLACLIIQMATGKTPNQMRGLGENVREWAGIQIELNNRANLPSERVSSLENSARNLEETIQRDAAKHFDLSVFMENEQGTAQKIENAELRSLLLKMLFNNPTERPSAIEVVNEVTKLDLDREIIMRGTYHNPKDGLERDLGKSELLKAVQTEDIDRVIELARSSDQGEDRQQEDRSSQPESSIRDVDLRRRQVREPSPSSETVWAEIQRDLDALAEEIEREQQHPLFGLDLDAVLSENGFQVEAGGQLIAAPSSKDQTMARHYILDLFPSFMADEQSVAQSLANNQANAPVLPFPRRR